MLYGCQRQRWYPDGGSWGDRGLPTNKFKQVTISHTLSPSTQDDGDWIKVFTPIGWPAVPLCPHAEDFLRLESSRQTRISPSPYSPICKLTSCELIPPLGISPKETITDERTDFHTRLSITCMYLWVCMNTHSQIQKSKLETTP